MASQPTSVSVTSPISPAIDRVKRLLFQPFDPGKWLVIGFCAWLAHLGEGRVGGNLNFGSWQGRGGGRRQFEQVRDYVLSNLHWILPLAAALMAVGLGLWVLFTWLSSRGRFMFLHCVVLDKPEVVEPWRQFAREANSLFLFRLGLGFAVLIPVLALFVPAGLVVFGMMDRGSPSIGGVMLLLLILVALIGLGIAFAVIAKLTTDFVVPIMLLRRRTCREGWGELLGLLSRNVGFFILYFLFQIVLAIAIGGMILIVVLATCCIAGCLLAIPYLGTVLLLPILIFDRCYSLYYLAQYGRDYDAFPSTIRPASGAAPPDPAPPATAS